MERTFVRPYIRKNEDGSTSRVRGYTRQAEGIPDRDYIAPIPKLPRYCALVVHRHLANRAGEHLDLRIADGSGRAHSWALRSMPEPGSASLAVQQPTHTEEYMRFEGVIPSGYGAGKVSIDSSDTVEVVESTADKIVFNRFVGKKADEFVLLRTNGTNWLLLNRSSTVGKFDLPRFKDKYKEEPYTPKLADLEGIMQPKIDGAHCLIYLKPGSRPRVFSYRESVRGDVLEYTHKVDGLTSYRVPGTGKPLLLRGEIFLVDKEGKALPADRTAGVLNSGVMKARKDQEGTGGLRMMPFDVYGSDKPYTNRLDDIRRSTAGIPFFLTPELASTKADKLRMLSKIENGAHPLTKEGVIVWRDGKPVKSKIVSDTDVYVVDVFEGEGKYAGSAGGIRYSFTKGGPIAGSVGTGFSDSMRKELWDNRDRITGRVAVIKHRRVTDNGTLFQPSFSNWHPDKDRGEY